MSLRLSFVTKCGAIFWSKPFSKSSYSFQQIADVQDFRDSIDIDHLDDVVIPDNTEAAMKKFIMLNASKKHAKSYTINKIPPPSRGSSADRSTPTSESDFIKAAFTIGRRPSNDQLPKAKESTVQNSPSFEMSKSNVKQTKPKVIGNSNTMSKIHPNYCAISPQNVPDIVVTQDATLTSSTTAKSSTRGKKALANY